MLKVYSVYAFSTTDADRGSAVRRNSTGSAVKVLFSYLRNPSGKAERDNILSIDSISDCLVPRMSIVLHIRAKD